MAMLNEKVVAETRQILAELREPVEVRYFTQEMECHACTHTDAFLAELEAIEPKLRVRRADFLREKEEAAALGIHHVPAMALRAGERHPVRYYGLPAGHEYGVFLRTLLMFSTGRDFGDLAPAAAASIARQVNLKVFVLHS